jgi:hypothetical protein
MMKKSPREAAMERGASPLLERTEMEAPCSRRNLIIDVLPRVAAWQRGVSPPLFRSSMPTSFCRRALAIDFWSVLTAMFSILSCPTGLEFGSAPWSSKTSMQDFLCFLTAS